MYRPPSNVHPSSETRAAHTDGATHLALASPLLRGLGRTERPSIHTVSGKIVCPVLNVAHVPVCSKHLYHRTKSARIAPPFPQLLTVLGGALSSGMPS
jgi:hypothetical protein